MVRGEVEVVSGEGRVGMKRAGCERWMKEG